jgi:uncharacterized protein YciI
MKEILMFEMNESGVVGASAHRWLRLVIVAALCVFAGFVSGCSRARESRDFTFVYLKTGPSRASMDASQLQEVFKGHMANIHRLADERRLLIAGPFNKPEDPTWRGIFILNTGNAREADAWVGTDPGVQAGVFAVERFPFRSDAALLESTRVEQEFQAERRATPSESPEIRPYVMVTAPDADAFERAVRSTPPPWGVVWCGRFKGGAGGVFAVDATDAAIVREWTKSHVGEHCRVDGWYSSGSLLAMPESVRRLP